jgi:hypothetical protein
MNGKHMKQVNFIHTLHVCTERCAARSFRYVIFLSWDNLFFASISLIKSEERTWVQVEWIRGCTPCASLVVSSLLTSHMA